MPLTKCPDCGKDVSTLAKACPNCGRPMGSKEFKFKASIGKNYCPYCAYALYHNGRYVGAVDGEDKYVFECSCGDGTFEAIHPKYDAEHYVQVATEKYSDPLKYEDVLFEEIKQNPLYDEKRRKKHDQIIRDFKWSDSVLFHSSDSPKCPTCGSTNIEKISTTAKVVGATMFGLFSKTARSQFKCKKCGYKW